MTLPLTHAQRHELIYRRMPLTQYCLSQARWAGVLMQPFVPDTADITGYTGVAAGYATEDYTPDEEEMAAGRWTW